MLEVPPVGNEPSSGRNIKVGVSMMFDEGFRPAIIPLVEDNSVDVLEWSFDTCWNWKFMAKWAQELIDHYSKRDRLLGHGVYYSALSAYSAFHTDWLSKLSEELSKRRYIHISEHYGFSRVAHVMRGAPLPLPHCPEAVEMGSENLRRLAQTAKCPIGLENLALAFSKKDVLGQGAFLQDLLRETNDFILLDLHNLYCQMENFAMSAEDLFRTFDLNKVKELHLSGGSWSDAASGRKIRRDTHDGNVPEKLYLLLELALATFPNIEYVILERLGNTVNTEEDVGAFRHNFKQIRNVVRARERSG